MEMKQLLELMLRNLVDQPEKVNVTAAVGQDTVLFEVHAAKEDLGKIIGKQGKNVQAIRTILNSVAAKQKKRTTLNIIE